MYSSTARTQQLIHHLQRSRHHAGGDDRADGLRAIVDAGEVHQHRADHRWVLRQPHAHLGGDAAHALAADERAAQVVAVRLGFVATQLRDLAVGQHDFEPEHVRGRHSVGQAMRPTGVVGDVAADRAALLAAGIGSEVQPVRRQLPGEIEVEHAGLDPRQPVDRIDREHPVHLRGDDHDGVVERRGPTGQARCRHRGRRTAGRGERRYRRTPAPPRSSSGKHTTPAWPSMLEASRS